MTEIQKWEKKGGQKKKKESLKAKETEQKWVNI